MEECDLSRQGSVCFGWVGPSVSPLSGCVSLTHA